MIRNYYTLLKIASELNSLAGSYISQVFTQDKDTVTFMLGKDDNDLALHFVADGRNDAFYLRKNFRRAKKNTTDLFEDIIEDTLQYASVVNRNRVLKLELINSDIYIILFGGINSNMLITTKKGKITAAFKQSEELRRTKVNFKANPAKNLRDFPPETKLLLAISNCDALLGKIYAEEICYRYNIDKNLTLENLGNNTLDDIIGKMNIFTNELISSTDFYVYDINGRPTLTLAQLQGHEIIKKFETVSEAVHNRIVTDIIDTGFLPEYKKIKSILQRMLRRSENKILNFSDDSDSRQRIDMYRSYADILMSQPSPNDKFGTKLETSDWDGNKIEIPLDEKLNLIDNAKKYYTKAKKSDVDLKIRKELLPKVKIDFEILTKLDEEFKKINNIKALEQFKAKNRKILGLQMNDVQFSKEDKYRKFDLGEDYILYVGKSAANNDELTMKFAKPNDLWFHARGMSGSHAVLRINDPKKKPPKYIMEQAAAIVAYYSGAKNAKYAPVAYTLKKNVRKPKGANPGSVVISREEVIMVTPGLPNGEE